MNDKRYRITSEMATNFSSYRNLMILQNNDKELSKLNELGLVRAGDAFNGKDYGYIKQCSYLYQVHRIIKNN